MIQIRNVEISTAGRRYNGSWHLEGDQVVHSSAYGSDLTKVGNDHKAAAGKVLTKLITARP